MKKYSVLLLYPDYIAETYGQDTYFTHVEADNVAGAIVMAQSEAEDSNVSRGELADFFPLLVIEGWHDDLTNQPED